MAANILPLIAAEYAPYNTMDAFKEGFVDYYFSLGVDNPYDGVKAQAWDRGFECAQRVQRWTEQNVGAD